MNTTNNTESSPIRSIWKQRWSEGRWRDSILAVVVIAAFFNLLSQEILIVLYRALTTAMGGQSPAALTIPLYASFITYWVVFLLLFFIPKRNRPLLETFKLGWKGNTAKIILIGFLLGFGSNALVALLASIAGNIHLVFDSFNILPLIICFIAVAVQCGAEELVYRGYIYRKLERSHKSPLVPIIVSSLLFACAHLTSPGMSPLPFINVFLCGTVLALIIYYWNSFWAAVAFHTAWNFTQNILLGLPNSGQVTPLHIFTLSSDPTSSFFYNPTFGIEGCAFTAVMLIALIAVFVFFGERKRKALQAADSAIDIETDDTAAPAEQQ